FDGCGRRTPLAPVDDGRPSPGAAVAAPAPVAVQDPALRLEPAREDRFRCEHEHRHAAVAVAVVAELAVLVRTPAQHPSAGHHRATVLRADADRARAAREAADIDRHVAVAAGAVAELAPAVAAPALDAATAGARAGVAIARGDRGDATRKPAHVDRHVAFRVAVVAEFTVLVRAPALRTAAAGDGTGVEATG